MSERAGRKTVEADVIHLDRTPFLRRRFASLQIQGIGDRTRSISVPLGRMPRADRKAIVIGDKVEIEVQSAAVEYVDLRPGKPRLLRVATPVTAG